MNGKFLSLTLAASIFTLCLGLDSCSKSSVDPISDDLKISASDEALEQSQEEEVDDIATNQLQVASQVSGKVQNGGDIRVACAKISLIAGDKQGAIIINFDSTATDVAPAGCQDALGNIRKGEMMISWRGAKWYAGGSSITINLLNYSINGVVINGSRELNNITDPASPYIIVWTVQADLTFAWKDNTSAQRTVDKTKTWDYKEGTITVTQPSGDMAVIGTDRQGKQYSVEITNGLLYTEECISSNKLFIPVAGTQVLTLDNSTALTIDYGANACDDTFAVTYNGKTDSFTANNTGD
jgi:hypothetical protein